MYALHTFALVFLLLAPASQAAEPPLAGPGRSVVAGPGLRQGVWHAFGPRDGLSDARVADIVQDPGRGSCG
jgi:hypothetical protein